MTQTTIRIAKPQPMDLQQALILVLANQRGLILDLETVRMANDLIKVAAKDVARSLAPK